jgi:hypothetical protein
MMLDKNNYSYYGDEMGLQRYKNILVNFVNLKKFDEVEKFVNEYISRVSEEIKDNFSLQYGILNFNRKLQGALLLKKIKYDYFTEYDVKIDIRIYYELKYYENAYSLLIPAFCRKTNQYQILQGKISDISWIHELTDKDQAGSKRFQVLKLKDSLSRLLM